MNDTKPSRGTLFLTFIGAAFVIAAVGLRTLRPITSSVNDPTLQTLNEQAAELAEFTSYALAKAQESRSAAEARLWTDAKLATWRSALPGGWRAQEITSIPAAFTTQRRFLLSNPAALFRDWPDIIRFLIETSDLPGVRIHSVGITAPAGAKRNFTQLQLLVGFSMPKPAAPVAAVTSPTSPENPSP